MSDSQQADVSKFTWLRVNTTTSHTGAPTNGDASTEGTEPDFVASPAAPSKMPTTGVLLQLQAPALNPAVPDTGDVFDVTVWLRDPATKRWASFETVQVGYRQLFVTYDVDASELYFQIGNIDTDGNIDIGLAVQ